MKELALSGVDPGEAMKHPCAFVLLRPVLLPVCRPFGLSLLK